MHTDYDKRMKKYESLTSSKLFPRLPLVIRLDGNSFHNYTREMEKPFCSVLHDAMLYAIERVALRMSGLKAVYTQSDEISFWLTDVSSDPEKHNTKGWFDWKLQKLVSISASAFTAHFNTYMMPRVGKEAVFDSRAFSLPSMCELNNYFLWREKDATRNSVSMLAQSKFSSKRLHGMSSNQMQELLFQEEGINWNDLAPWMKRGTLVVHKTIAEDITFTHKKGIKETKKGVKRKKWMEVEFDSFITTPIHEIVERHELLEQGVLENDRRESCNQYMER